MYDLIIIGAGPAGLTASIYASRYKLNHIVIGKEIGGQITKGPRIENWPGFEAISGPELMEKFSSQVKKLGAEIYQDEVASLQKNDDGFFLKTANGYEHQAKKIILALGMTPRKLGVPGEEALVGRGVSYCPICDAAFFKEKEVAVIGGGDSAAKTAIHLSEFATKISVFYIKDNLIMEPALVEKIKENEKIEMVPCEKVLEIKGDGRVAGIVVENDGQSKEYPLNGVFVEIGSVPGVEIAKSIGVETDESGYILVGADQSTNVSGIYAAGDVTTGSNRMRQLITASSEGAIAAGSVYKSLKTS